MIFPVLAKQLMPRIIALPLPQTFIALYLQRIKLVHFKNYREQELSLNPHLNCLVGANGMGKTNLLDAIYYLCVGKSYFGTRDRYLVLNNESFFRLEGDLLRQDVLERLVIKVEPGKRKDIERDRVVYDKLSEHVGRFPVVIIAPDDTALVTEGSEVRRRLINNTLSQSDGAYLRALIKYNQLLKQRNALLKQADGRKLEEDLLLVYDRQLAEAASLIFTARQDFVNRFEPVWREAYSAISGGKEEVGLRYRSQLTDANLLQLLQDSREKDRILERTTVGVHKDELVFSLNEQPLKRIGSQGQLKTFVLALKLGQYQFLRTEKSMSPILLLDDIFDKLDPNRVGQLVQYILTDDFGQVFLSDTDSSRIQRLLDQQEIPRAMFQVIDGQIEALI